MLWMVVMVVVVDGGLHGWLVSEGFSKHEVLPHQSVGFVAIVVEALCVLRIVSSDRFHPNDTAKVLCPQERLIGV